MSKKRERLLRLSMAVLASFVWSTLYPALAQAGPAIPGYYGKITASGVLPSAQAMLPKVATGPVAPAGTAIPGYYGNRSLPAIGATDLPTGWDPATLQGATVDETGRAQGRLVIKQNQSKAILQWQTFNIGEDAEVHFDQTALGTDGKLHAQPNWVALNRVLDPQCNPSQILGKLTADGGVYLINQNGILFGPKAQVNLHTLVATALNLHDNDFLNNVVSIKDGPHFDAEDYTGSGGYGAVSNLGHIETDSGGSVFLFAPVVENGGVIITPNGQIALAAGTHAYLSARSDGRGLLVDISASEGHTVTNLELGQLLADSGVIGMYGYAVNQQGVIKATTAIRRNGIIELHAVDGVTLGPNSLTACDISDSTEKVVSLPTNPGTIEIAGLDRKDYDSHGNVTLAKTPANGSIVVQGVVRAPSGQVTLDAKQSVSLEDGSRVSVAGCWVDEPGDANVIQAKLTSEQLAGDQGQKTGLLKGQTVTVNGVSGSTIGDVSGSLHPDGLTARERSTAGGQILIDPLSKSGQITIAKNASVDFSGGGYTFGKSQYTSTKLLSGQKIYDISHAPQWLDYSDVIVSQQVNKGSGYTQTFLGLYCGGAAPLRDSWGSYKQGADAGGLYLYAPKVSVLGYLNGSVVRGLFQTQPWDSQDPYGRSEPKAGELSVGTAGDPNDPQHNDCLISDILVTKGAPDATGSDLTVKLSADILNAAGLGSLNLYSNNSITIDSGTALSLQPGGSFQAMARRIDNQGEISVFGGTVKLTTMDTKTSDVRTFIDYSEGQTNPNFVPLAEGIYLEPGSKITAAGERIDNSLTQLGVPLRNGHVNGGTIDLCDGTRLGSGVFQAAGSTLDVSGGYSISSAGKLTGGSAGALGVQGAQVSLGGKLTGLSLPGCKGGTISLSADNIRLAEAGTALADQPDWLVMADDRLADTGFTQIALHSVHDFQIDDGVTLSPSLAKLPTPVAGQQQGVAVPGYRASSAASGSEGAPIMVGRDFIGASSLSLEAGASPFKGTLTDKSNYDSSAGLSLPSRAMLATGPQGTVSLTARADVDIAGTIDAPAGTVTATSSSSDVSLEGHILAAGYNRPESAPVAKGLPTNYTTLAGGTVSLQATGSLSIGEGAVIDVSGSDPVAVDVPRADKSVGKVTLASDPGTIDLRYGKDLQLAGGVHFQGRAKQAGVRGGTFKLSHLNYSAGELDLTAAFIGDLISPDKGGFDALSFRSQRRIGLVGPMDLDVGRQLTLDAPELACTGADSISLHSLWTQLLNTSSYQSQASAGSATLSLGGDWLDVKGSLALSGASTVTLKADHDLTLADAYYPLTDRNPEGWVGLLRVPGDLNLQGARIYPTTYSFFDVEAGGKVKIAGSGAQATGPIYSAGGRLTIHAHDIEHDGGLLAAPMGWITLNADHRVYLAQGSRISTAGSGLVNLGFVDNNLTTWDVQDKGKGEGTVRQTPLSGDDLTGRVSINGAEVIGRKDSSIDVSAVDSSVNAATGGAVFAYLWQKGIEGTVNPLEQPGVHVILPGVNLPTTDGAVYIDGAPGLAAGVYSLLPESYAFVPGAIIVTDLNQKFVPGQAMVTQQGYRVVSGYATVLGDNLYSPQPTAYSVRPASDVLKEGFFAQPPTARAKDAGSLSVRGTAVILDGTVKGAAQPGGKSGSLTLSAQNIVVQAATTPLGDDFGPDSDLPADRLGQLELAARGLTGLGELRIGTDQDGNVLAHTITVKDQSVLSAPLITLAATDKISLESGTEIDGDTLTLLSRDAQGKGGEIDIAGEKTTTDGAGNSVETPAALVHASKLVSLDAGKLQLSTLGPDGQRLFGRLKSDSGAFKLAADSITVVQDASGIVGTSPGGLYLTSGLSGFETGDPKGLFSLQLTSRRDTLSRSEVVFTGDASLGGTAAPLDSLTIDAGRLVASGDRQTVSLTAHHVSLLNTGTAPDSGAQTAAGTNGSLSVAGDDVSIGKGDVRVDGFSDVKLNSQGDLTFCGVGSLTTGGDLTMSAARVTTGAYQRQYTDADGNDQYEYQAPRFAVNAGNNTVSILSNGGVAGQAASPGGSLSVVGRRVGVGDGALIEAPSAQVTLEATGSGADDGVALGNGARILARGGDYLPGGQITLKAAKGPVALSAGSLLDVSAGKQGDAGSVNLASGQGGVSMNGDIQGQAQGGQGGSFALDTATLDSFASFQGLLLRGGFNGDLDVRVRVGDVNLKGIDRNGDGLLDPVRATSFRLSADSGKIDINTNINTSGAKGGSVELNAAHDLTLHDGCTIDASATGTGSAGGQVLLASADGFVNLGGDSMIDVSAGQGGTGGTLRLRASRYAASGSQANDVKVALPVSTFDGTSHATVTGAFQVSVEANKTYSVGDGDPTHTTTLTTANLTNSSKTGWLDEADAFMNAAATTVGNRLALLNRGNAQLALLPGIEVRAGGNVNLGAANSAAWDLTRFNGDGTAKPGALTIRAAGNLTVNADLVGHPHSWNTGLVTSAAGVDSWDYSLVAGADLTGANRLAVSRGRGDLNIAAGKAVYTESGRIDFASGHDTIIGAGSNYKSDKTWATFLTSMRYNVATYDGSISGQVGNDLTISGGAIQSATGDISLKVGRNLTLQSATDLGTKKYVMGAIRTTGRPALADASGNKWDAYDRYEGGGDITVDAGGTVNAGLADINNPAWDTVSSSGHWTPNYVQSTKSNTTAGIATMAGGSLEVRSGGDLSGQMGAFGPGDVALYAGGDVNGRFVAGQTQTQTQQRQAQAKLEVAAGGNYGGNATYPDQAIEICDAQVSATAMGNLSLGTVANPAVARDASSGTTESKLPLGYSANTSVKLTAVNGDVSLSGRDYYYKDSSFERILPPTVEIRAGRGIHFGNHFTLPPAAQGNLVLRAGGDISGAYTSGSLSRTASIYMLDTDPNIFYGQVLHMSDLANVGTPESHYQGTPVHTGDPTPISISATGDISDINLYLPKQAELRAGGNINDIYLVGQNVGLDDVTAIKAQGDILFSTKPSGGNTGASGIQVGGPGYVVVEAGGSMDLGTTTGIQATGQGFNSWLPAQGAQMAVLAGTDLDIVDATDAATSQGDRLAKLTQFFADLQDLGKAYNQKLKEGDKVSAQGLVDQADSDVYGSDYLNAPDYLTNPRIGVGHITGAGNIEMTMSSINNQSNRQDQDGHDYLPRNKKDRNGNDVIGKDGKVITEGGGGSLTILATGHLDIGRSNFSTTDNATGIYTACGGYLNVFAIGNVNVLESRLMTFRGGDIFVWSDTGSINAGRGSPAAINASPPGLTNVNGVEVQAFTPPAVGSGIRTLTYDPDGPEGPQQAPDQGDILVCASRGDIDAGEAGISGRNVSLGALQVLNAQNISATGTSVGVPIASDASVGLSSLSGSGAVAEATKMVQATSVDNAGRDSLAAKQIADNIFSMWDVQVIGFEEAITW